MPCDIPAKHQELGGPSGPLGAFTDIERQTPDGLGRFRTTQHGGIWCREVAFDSSFGVWGLIFRKWRDLGGTTSFLGWPTSDEMAIGTSGGRISFFERGAILYHPQVGTFEVHGAIFRRWLNLGDVSRLGFPLTDELATPDGRGRYNHFQNGSIYWTPTTGAWEVSGQIKQQWAGGGWERGLLRFPVAAPGRMPGSTTDFQDFEGGTVYANGINVMTVQRQPFVYTPGLPVLRWNSFNSLLSDRDFIHVTHTPAFVPQFGSTLTLVLGGGLTWWKGISLFTPSRNDFAMVTVDGTRRRASVQITPDQLQGGPIYLRLHKAKVLGIHTPMYLLDRPDRLVGSNTTFTWLVDG